MTTAEPLLLPDCPTDGITKLCYLGEKPLVASTSWDGSLRVHDTSAKALMLSHAMEAGPLFSLAVAENAAAGKQLLFTGGMDGSIRMLDMETEKPVLIGRHEGGSDSKACSCLSSLGDNENNMVVSAGWHRKLHLWDTRQKDCVSTVELPGKAFSMDVDSEKTLAVVATSGRRTCFVDLRSTNSGKKKEADLVLDRESSLKYQIRCLRFFPDGNAIAVGSIEGRAAVEFLDELGRPAQGNKKYAFKCHRNGDMVYPVNAIDFHPRFGTFATGGCDGTVVLWDGLNKKKLTSLPAFPTSIAALAFNHDGSELAIASSYTFEEGEREHPKDEIYIRNMLESECRPKSKS